MNPSIAQPAPADTRVDPLRAELTALDFELLSKISWLRVVTQAQIARLFSEIPERTLRYRVRRMHRLGLVGRSRPYRDSGSAPHHLWPTNRGDAVARERPRPRRGERRPPNPIFLEHTAAISDLYASLRERSRSELLAIDGFRREGEARVDFTDRAGFARAIAPDVRLAVRFLDEAALDANVELDLGTMSHGRLRTKLAGYLEHVAVTQAAGDRDRPLLFLTSSHRRAETFAAAAARLREEEGISPVDLPIAVCPLARELGDALDLPCWTFAGAQGPALTLAELAGQLPRHR